MKVNLQRGWRSVSQGQRSPGNWPLQSDTWSEPEPVGLDTPAFWWSQNFGSAAWTRPPPNRKRGRGLRSAETVERKREKKHQPDRVRSNIRSLCHRVARQFVRERSEGLLPDIFFLLSPIFHNTTVWVWLFKPTATVKDRDSTVERDLVVLCVFLQFLHQYQQSAPQNRMR